MFRGKNRLILRLALLWLGTAAAMLGWATININGSTTSNALDVTIWTLFFFLLLALVPPFSGKYARSWVAWITGCLLFVLAISFGWVYLNYPSLNPPNYSTFQTVYYFFFRIINTLYSYLGDAHKLRNAIPAQFILLGTAICLLAAAGLVAIASLLSGLLMTFTVHLTWFAILRRRLNQLPFRWGRLQMWSLRLLGLILGMILIASIPPVLTALPVEENFIDQNAKQIDPPRIPPSIESLFVDNANHVIYAYSSEHGTYYSIDEGENWQKFQDAMTNKDVNALAWDRTGGALFVGTGNGIFYSADEGQNWQARNSGLPSETKITSLLFDGSGQILYAGTDKGFYRSADQGQNWQAANQGLPSQAQISVLQSNSSGQVLFAGTVPNGVYRSTDGGQNWQLVNKGLPSGIQITALQSDDTGQLLYAGTGIGIYRSIDGGQSWQEASGGLPKFTQTFALASDRSGKMVYSGTINGIYRSTDQGQSWQPANEGISNLGAFSLLSDETGQNLYAGTGNGLYRSIDGVKSWKRYEGLNKPVSKLLLDRSGQVLFAGTQDWIYRSLDGGQNWQVLPHGLTSSTVSAFVYDPARQVVYLGTSNGVSRSTDGGKSWQSANKGMENIQILSLALDSTDNTLYAGVYGGIYRSIDNGQSWQKADIGQNFPQVNVLLQDDTAKILYAGTNYGLYRSSDKGQSWQVANQEPMARHVPNPAGVPEILALVSDPSGKVLYAATDQGLYRSRDGGKSWQPVGPVMMNSRVAFLVWNRAKSTLYAGSSVGIFRSIDGGDSWQQTGQGLPNQNVNALALNEAGQSLYAGTDSGVFRSTDGGQNWQAASEGIPDAIPVNIAVDLEKKIIYLGFRHVGLFRSIDGGLSWQSTNWGLPNSYMYFFIWNNTRHILLADLSNSLLYETADGGESWEAGPKYPRTAGTGYSVTFSKFQLVVFEESPYKKTYVLSDDWQSWKRTSDIGQLVSSFTPDTWQDFQLARTPSGELQWFCSKCSPLFSMHSMEITPTHTYWLDGRVYFYGMKDQKPYLAQFDDNAPRYPLFTMLLLMYAFTYPALFYSSLGLVAIILITLRIRYLLHFRTPIWTIILPGTKIAGRAEPALMDKAWVKWRELVHAELLRWGDILPDDLLGIPAPFRKYSIQRYFNENQHLFSLQEWRGGLRLVNRSRLGEWRKSWVAIGRMIGSRAGLPDETQLYVDRLAELIANPVGLTPEPGGVFEAVRGYRVQAPELFINLPERFPLLFVADPDPSNRTVQMLIDAVGALKEGDRFFALVIALEPPVRQMDVPNILRQAVQRVPHAHDLVILGKEDALELLAAVHPAQHLARLIGRQIDLTYISPFIINGPVSPVMAVGRENETRKLVEQASMHDFAIIGNRKIGKTTLLRRTEERLSEAGSTTPLFLDCQFVRSAADFYTEFAARSGLKLNQASPTGLLAALRGYARNRPMPVLLVDEVDVLLSADRDGGGALASAWRTLAQERTCHFIFCGSGGLARMLKDNGSAMFNFPEPLPLGCLERDKTDLLLTQPLDMLGIVREEERALLNSVWELTSGHPNLVQYVGRGLVEAANRRKDHRVTPVDLAMLQETSTFIDFYFDTVWGACRPLEKLVTLVAPPGEFTLAQVLNCLADEKINSVDEAEVAEALRLLTIYAILSRSGRNYYFIQRSFPDLLARTQDIDSLIRIERNNLMINKGAS